MTEHRLQSTVMGLGGSYSTFDGRFIKAPAFKTIFTSKQEHRKDLRLWIEMVSEYAAIDVEGNKLQRTAEHLAYLSCDATARER